MRGTTTATGEPACLAAISATRPRPSPARTAAIISKCAPLGVGRDSGAWAAIAESKLWSGHRTVFGPASKDHGTAFARLSKSRLRATRASQRPRFLDRWINPEGRVWPRFGPYAKNSPTQPVRRPVGIQRRCARDPGPHRAFQPDLRRQRVLRQRAARAPL